MSKCVKCGNEILTGDIHWEMGLCNNCYNELYKDHKTHISLDKMWLNLAQSFRDENEKLQEKISDLETKLAESEKSKESYRLQNEQHHLQLLQFYSRLGVEAFGADIHEKALETLMIMKEELEEKNGVERALSACNRQNDEFSDMIKKLVNEKEELKQQLAKKEEEKNKMICHIGYDNFKYLMANNDWQILEAHQVKEYNQLRKANQNKISFTIDELEKVKSAFGFINPKLDKVETIKEYVYYIDHQIKQLKERCKND